MPNSSNESGKSSIKHAGDENVSQSSLIFPMCFPKCSKMLFLMSWIMFLFAFQWKSSIGKAWEKQSSKCDVWRLRWFRRKRLTTNLCESTKEASVCLLSHTKWSHFTSLTLMLCIVKMAMNYIKLTDGVGKFVFTAVGAPLALLLDS